MLDTTVDIIAISDLVKKMLRSLNSNNKHACDFQLLIFLFNFLVIKIGIIPEDAFNDRMIDMVLST